VARSRAGHLDSKNSREEIGTTPSPQNAHPNNEEASKANPKPAWMGILRDVTMSLTEI